MNSASSRASMLQTSAPPMTQVATLTGHVPTHAQMASVETIVCRVKGIAEEVEVRPFGANPRAGDEIAKHA